ncbi:DNA-binding response regulator [Undibacterium terreum]|uniref:DNA-binding response regulator n=1 Tax=Undibacterium terreum TaxID=1224302 RepID=A0A916XSB3_9BURK|nr:DNA-binding response regulator [Undibacterium terreum]
MHPFLLGQDLLNELKRESYDLLVLDLLVPDVSGVEILQWVREKLPPTLPVLVLTNLSAEEEVVACLQMGADDYVVKPPRHSELVARVQALLRRAYPQTTVAERTQYGIYRFETGSGNISVNDVTVEMTQKEYDLTRLFFSNLNRALSRAHILEAIWSRDIDVPSRTMDTHISKIRAKLELRPENGYRLTPVYSYGYRLEEVGKD